MANATVLKKTRVAWGTLGALDTAGGVISWQNNEGQTIIITRVVIYTTTKATGACTIDVGTTATNGTTSSNNLLTGLDVGTAAGVFDNINEAGASGKARQTLANGKWVTGSMASGAAAGLVGNFYIEYILV